MDYSDFSRSMREEVADTQAEIFVYAEKQGYDMESFIEGYMRSDFCNQEMDSVYSYFHCKPDTVCFGYIDKTGMKKITEQNDNPVITDPGWIGSVYRYMVFFSGLSSREIVEMVSPKEMDDFSITYDCWEHEDAAKDILKRLQEERS